jgi:hypothetical protein
MADTYSVCDEVANTREDLSRNDDSSYNSAETLLGENDVSGGHGSISCTRHCNSDVGMLQGGSIINTITSGTDRVAEVTKCFNNQVLMHRESDIISMMGNDDQRVRARIINDEHSNTYLVLGKHGGKAVSSEAHVTVGLSEVRGLLLGLRIQHRQVLRGENLSSHVECLCSLLRNQQVVTGYHFHANSILAGILNCLLSIRARRIQESQETEHFPLVLSILQIHLSYRKSSNTHLTETDNFGFDFLLNVSMSITHQVQKDVGSTFGRLKLFAGFGVTNGALSTLDGWVEGEEI